MQIGPDEYQGILADVGPSDEVIDTELETQYDLASENEETYASTDDEESEGEFSDRDSN